METVSFSIANYGVPCNNNCRYCLLSYSGKIQGVSFEEGKALAGRILDEIV